MKVDLKGFKELRDAIGFHVPKTRDTTATGDAEFVYSLCTDFEDSTCSWVTRYNQAWWVDYIDPNNLGYSFMDGVNFESRCWGVFRYKGKYYKATWSYCNAAGEMDYYDILKTLREVKSVTKTITTWEPV